MAISEVQKWISDGKQYQKGVTLLRSLSDNEALIELLDGDDDDYNRERLHAELLALDRPSEPVPSYDPHDSFHSVSELKKESWNTIKFNPELKEMAIRSGELTTKINNHRAQLELVTTDEQRFVIAEIIVKTAQERQKLFQTIDHFQKYGKMPELPPEPVVKNLVPSVELMKKYKNLASRISKAKKKQQLDKAKELEHEREKIREVLQL